MTSDLKLSGSPCVLVVDDNDPNRIVASSYCEAFGCDVKTASDGVEAVDICRVEPFDGILMDVHMPRLNGIVAAARIRTTAGRNAETPIVMVTGEADLSDDDLRCCKIAAVLVKPYSMAALFETLQATLVSSRTVLEAARTRAA